METPGVRLRWDRFEAHSARRQRAEDHLLLHTCGGVCIYDAVALRVD